MSTRNKTYLFDKTAYYVRITNDYSKFRFAEGNRDVERVSQLKKSIRENGYYRQPILVNENFEIIEGQHRFVVCKELGIPIEYVVQNGLTVKDCAPLNVGRRNWNIDNYIHLGTTNGTDDYRYFELMRQRFGFTPRITWIATGNRGTTGGYANYVIKNGTLKCSPEQYNQACVMLEWLSQFREDIKMHDLRGRKEDLYAALIFAWKSKQTNIDALTDRVHRNFSMYGRAIADIADAIDKTDKIYNFRCNKENKIDLVSEYRQASRREEKNGSKGKG